MCGRFGGGVGMGGGGFSPADKSGRNSAVHSLRSGLKNDFSAGDWAVVLRRSVRSSRLGGNSSRDARAH